MDPRHIFDRCFCRVLHRYLSPNSSGSLVEVGCAPGRWLIYCHEKFGFRLAGFEFSRTGIAKTRQNLLFNKMEADLFLENFLTCDLLGRQYDVVLSLGFIEHFQNPEPVFERQAQLLKPGGTMIVEVPNLRGVNGILASLSRSNMLLYHNLKVMDRGVLRNLAEKVGLESAYIGYIGGFEPGLFDASAAPAVVRHVFDALNRLRRKLEFLDFVNAGGFSGYLVAVLRKGV